MTDEIDMNPPAAPAIQLPVVTGDASSIVGVLLAQLDASEKRLTAAIDRNATSAMRRWEAHDIEHRTLAEAIGELKRQFDEHLRLEREEDLIFDARIAPARRLGMWLGKEWRTVLIALLFAADLIQRNLNA